jgi:hypothetical protein
MFEGSDIVFLEAASGEEAVKIFAFEHPAGRGGNPTPARSEFSLKSGVT